MDKEAEVNHTQFEAYTNALRQRLEADERTLALVALGSMAEQSRWDEWSDHDFWLVTTAGIQEAFLSDLSWLPNHERISLPLRQADRYYTVLYDDGHIAEFAVFASDELSQAKTNAYHVLFDKGGITPQVEQVYQATQDSATTYADIDAAFELGNFVPHLWVGVTRYWRGEVISSYKYVTQFALVSA